MGSAPSKANKAAEVPVADVEAVKTDILRMMNAPEWDDGTYGPILIRLAWHSSGTYCAKNGTGGSNGATMRYPLEAGDPENVGLADARRLFEPLKAKYPAWSYADLWVLAAYCALETSGGPKIEFHAGRTDAAQRKAIAPGRLPKAEAGVAEGMEVDSEGRIKGWENTAKHIREVFSRMGFSDRETVALICGGHVYGRCHTGSSGYAGAWVENPTRFSNEYAADMFGDEWILVTHDSKMPDGGDVPEEVRPAPGKRQYIDYSKYNPEPQDKAHHAPDSTHYPPGKYLCVTDWCNCREKPETDSPIVGRFNQGEHINMMAIKVFGTAIRGCTERGGWVSIVASGGKALFQREGNIDTPMLVGTWRRLANVPYFGEPQAAGSGQGNVSAQQFDVVEAHMGKDNGKEGAIFGRVHVDGGARWAMLYSPAHGALAEKVVDGYNDKPRKPIIGQSGQQMMLITDMVMLWDPNFRAVLKEYADDQTLLSNEFGAAFQRLTELGCPWSQDYRAGCCPLLGC